MFTVEDTKLGNLKIYFRHVHDPDNTIEIATYDEDGEPKGSYLIKAITSCIVEDGLENEIAIAQSHCSVKDNFSRERGRKTALLRAVQQIFDREKEVEERQKIWDAYFEI